METHEFIRRRDENTAEYHRQVTANSFDIKKFHGFDIEAGMLGRWELSKKPHDILSAVLLGFLPILRTKTGFDAMRLDGTQFVGVELKSSYTDNTKFIKTKLNAIYSATADKIVDGKICRNNTTSFKSNFNATYDIKENLGMKNIDTYLIIADNRVDEIVDCFVIGGYVMETYLNGKLIPDSGKVQIKLSTFEKLGKQYTETITPIIGLEKWKQSLLPNLPIVHVVNKPLETNTSLPILDCESLTKTDPIEQNTNPCIEDNDPQGILDFLGTAPSTLS